MEHAAASPFHCSAPQSSTRDVGAIHCQCIEVAENNEKTPFQITACNASYNTDGERIVNASSDVPLEDATYWGLWRNHGEYRWYLMSSLVTNAGEWFSYVASIAAIEQIHSSNNTMSRTSISILVALRLLPNALFSNIGGVLADSYDRRKILLILDILGAFIACFFLLAYQLKSIPALYAATVCQMTVAAIYEPCRSALVPMLITKEGYLKKALTLTGLTWSVMASVGATTGGLATEYFGIDACFFIDSATYLLSAGFIWRIRGEYIAVNTSEDANELAPVDEDNVDEPCIRADDNSQLLSFTDFTKMTVDGFSYLRSKPWGAFVFLKGCAALIYGAADVLNVAFSERGNGTDDNVLEGSSERLGILFAFVGIGCFFGPLITELFTDMDNPRSLEGACLASYLSMAFGCWGLAKVRGFLSICIFTSVRAAGSSIIWIYSTLLLQVSKNLLALALFNTTSHPCLSLGIWRSFTKKFCANSMFGRVMAFDYAIATLSEAISAMCGGLFQDSAGLSPEEVSYVMAMVAVVTVFFWARYFYYGVRVR